MTSKDRIASSEKDDLLNGKDSAEESKALQHRLRSGHFNMQGRRPTMEDRHTVLEHPEFSQQCMLQSRTPRSFFAVFDGHGGHVSAEYCRRNLHLNIAAEMGGSHSDSEEEANGHANGAGGTNTVEAIKRGVLATDANFNSAARELHLTTSSGTCAIIILIEGDVVICANVGDSRSVLCSKGRPIALSEDHKPGRPDERKRIEELGGAVARSEQAAFSKETCWSSICSALHFCSEVPLRVYPGGLAVSRTIGDIGLKATSLISAEPELRVHKVVPGEDEFIILACDGIWDVLSNQRAVTIVRQSLLKGRSPEEAARDLCQAAFDKGSTDNISVIVVCFDPDGVLSSS